MARQGIAKLGWALIMNDTQILDWIEKEVIGLRHDFLGQPYIEHFDSEGRVVQTEGETIRDCVIRANEDK